MTRLAPWMLLLVLLVLAVPPAVGEDEEAAPYEPKTLAPSWRDQATAAYNAKRWADAIFLYRKWLEADPHDDGSWYNLACTYALAGQREAAVEAFETAVDAGWTDAGWPTEDPDLETIREEARFHAALVRCEANETKEGPRDFERHWVRIPAMTTYLALLPPDYEATSESYPLVVILHGNGSSEMGHGRVADQAGREGVIYVVPRAPYPHVQVFTQMRRPGWTWRPQDADEDDLEALDPEALYVDAILACVEDARRRYRVREGRFHVLGHSMGAFFANVTAILHPEQVAAVLAYAGGLPEAYHDPKWLRPLAEQGVRFLHVHGTDDPVVNVNLSDEAHERMQEAGVDTTIRLLDGVDHGIREPVQEVVKTWIREVVRGGEGDASSSPPPRIVPPR